ncbi:MAG: ABC transporter permease [Pyrinomonadaceae bacterium]|nr:ABC transporter permease [Pyrinomonadaceae bacterium]
MRWWDELRYIARHFDRRRAEQNLEDEIRLHLELETQQNIEDGMSPEEARYAAERAFGSVTLAKEDSRAMWGLRLLETLWQDARFSVRRMFKSPGFSLVAIVSLALGIGANTAIFSLVNTVLLRPLPVPHSEQLVSVFPVAKDDSVQAFSYPTYVDFRDRNDVLSGLYVTRFAPMSLSREGTNERVWGYLVSGNYFDVLGISAAHGRTFLPEEDRTRLSHPVVVVSYGCWQRRFGADPSLVGKNIVLNNHNFTVVGIAPEGFNGSEIAYTPELWVPMMMQSWIEPGGNWLERRDTQNLFATGRLKPGVSAVQAQASLNLLAQQIGQEYPDTNEGQTITLTPPGLIHPILRGPVISFAGVLMGIVSLVLLIACTNLANLLLARATERRREIAVRLALGASRLRLVRQLLTESVLLSILGGVAGLLLALWAINLIAAFKPPIDFPLTLDLKLDWRVFGFSLLVSLLTGVLFGLVPALQSTRPELVPALKDATSQLGYHRSRLRSGLVVAQVALSLVLLIAAGLVVRTLQHLQTMSPGFEPDNALMMSVDVGLQGYDKVRGQQFYRQLIERVEALPGVRSAAVADFVPLSLNYNSTDVYVEGQPPARGANVPTVMNASVGSNYFSTMAIPLMQGREFGEMDKEDAPRVCIINEAFARRFFPGANPVESAIGKRVGRGTDGPFAQIVGVATDGKYFSINETARPFIYFPLSHSYSSNAILLVRTNSDPKRMIAPVRREVGMIDQNMPVYEVKTLTEHLGLSLFPARVAAVLLGSFGLLALALAAIGVYGVMSYSVAQRTREIGIRIALGAQPREVLKLVARQGVTLATVGLVAGLFASVVLTRLMSSLLYGVSATDAETFIAISLLLLTVILLACYVPARRATKVDPMVALRYE